MNFRDLALIFIFYRAPRYNLSVYRYTLYIYCVCYTTSVDKSYGGGFATTTTVLYYYLGVGIQYIISCARSRHRHPALRRGGDGLLSCPAGAVTSSVFHPNRFSIPCAAAAIVSNSEIYISKVE